ncbi:unnamed protein product [Klebsiella pneumoniae]|nr:unnamed protein product [Klebsiella pneumoniae]
MKAMNTLQSTNWLQYGIKDIKHLKHANMHDPLIPFEPVFSPRDPLYSSRYVSLR